MKTIIIQFVVMIALSIVLWLSFSTIKIYSEYDKWAITYSEPQTIDFDPSQRIVDIPNPSLPYRYKSGTCAEWGKIIDSKTENETERKWLKDVMFCESSCNAGISSPSGTYKGLYQYEDRTWNANCSGSIWDGEAQIDCTIELYRKGETFRWPNCP